MTDEPAATCKLGRDKTGRWLPGHSGNPKGAIKNRLSMTLDEMTRENANLIAGKLLELIEMGDTQVLLALMRRSMPRTRRIQLKGLSRDNPAAAILSAASEGLISPEEASSLAGIVKVAKLAQDVEEIRKMLEELKK